MSYSDHGRRSSCAFTGAASPFDRGPRLPRSALVFSACFSDAPVDHSPEVWAAASSTDPSLALSEHGRCLVGGINTLDDAFCTTKIAIHSGAGALAPFVVWRFSIHAPDRLSLKTIYRSHALARCGIHCARAEMHPSILEEFCRIDASETVDECTPERPLFSRR